MAVSLDNVYMAPITLGFIPSEGDIIRGTVNGVEVGGRWKKDAAELHDGSNNPICEVGYYGERIVVIVEQESAPTNDYELHLYRYTPKGIVQIPQRYVEGLEEITANANQALETATAAQSTADAAQSTADVAKSTADAAKSTADAAKSIDGKKEDRACGIIWHNSSYNVIDIVYGNGIYIARNLNAILKPLYSEDAISWNNINLNLTSSDWEIAYGQGKFVMLQELSDGSGTAIYTSTDGKMWVKHTDQLGMRFDTVQYIDELWVAYTKGNSGKSSGLWYSEDGINWSQSNINSGRVFGIAKSANKWVAIHLTTGIYYSEDGKTYTLSNLTGEKNYGVIRYANGIFVYAYKDTVRYSENGEIWEQATLNDVSLLDVTDVMYEDGIWVMANSHEGLMYSVDGKTWSPVNEIYLRPRFLTYGDGTWVAYGNNSSSEYPAYSKDGMNWNKCNIAESNINKPVYADGIWIAPSGNGLFYSSDAADWYKIASTDNINFYYYLQNINGVWHDGSYYSVDKYLSRETANDKLAELNSQLDNLSKKISDDVIINSSTPDSTKKFKITVGDDARPTFTDTSNPNNTWTPGDNLPTVTASDSGKFLRVSENGEWIADVTSDEIIQAVLDALPAAEGVSY